MSNNDEYTNYVLDQLMPLGVVLTSRLFGGTLLKVENKQLGVVLQGRLYFKVKESELVKKFEAMDSEPFEYERSDRDEPVRAKAWLSVPEEILEDQKQLVALAYEVLLQGS